ncbi:hypothetical protein QTP81_01965 [Alteromonas sp. ASW11-36]|uniref:Uncharacterized protein n=1 Tax=Alteromonas arenosi TaxID=3055817 RepID=A0ABT7ST80_9ALTE|nr:hypothetical protein [Alteromonas sp. ASW11-36]MDM7859371.1 hypothetical protein [Alteromonas sp. ASW11-36]
MADNQTSNPELQAEWQVLQNQFDSYEKFSLIIKLVAICTFVVFISTQAPLFLFAITFATLWLQDAIWKTFQARIENRILAIESALVSSVQIAPFQFNRDFAARRLGPMGLVLEYCKAAIKPTVAFPHLVIIAAILISEVLF